MPAFQNPEHEVDAAQAQRLINERDTQIIEVREQYEHDAGHIPNDAYPDMQHVALETGLDRSRPSRHLLLPGRNPLRHGRRSIQGSRMGRLQPSRWTPRLGRRRDEQRSGEMLTRVSQ